MRAHDHVTYFAAPSPNAPTTDPVACRAHVVEVIDADTLTLDVDRPGVATERLESVPRCDAATPAAGHWSTVP